jgi:hypothetical protein
MLLIVFGVSILQGCSDEEEYRCWEELLDRGSGEAVTDIWGFSETSQWIVNDYGGIEHCNGWECEGVGGIAGRLVGIWGSSEMDIYAIPDEGTIIHYDGMDLSGVSAIQPEEHRYYTDIWGSAWDDVFVVGYHHEEGSGPLRSRILHFDGTEWTITGHDYGTLLYAIWGSGANDVFAVGSDSIYHYNGIEWSVMEQYIQGKLYGVWGLSSDDVYAFGEDGTIMHYDGNEWTTSGIDTTQDFTNAWGTSDDNIFVCTSWGFVFHYDGEYWKKVFLEPLGFRAKGVWGFSPTDVFVVGDKWVGLSIYGTVMRNKCEIEELRAFKI